MALAWPCEAGRTADWDFCGSGLSMSCHVISVSTAAVEPVSVRLATEVVKPLVGPLLHVLTQLT